MTCQKIEKYAHASVPLVRSVVYTYFITLRDIIILGVSCYKYFSFPSIEMKCCSIPCSSFIAVEIYQVRS
jgi:hypothetical protein